MIKREKAVKDALKDFNEIDKNQSGYLDRREIATLARKQGSRFGDLIKNVDDFISTLDIDGDGKISLDEWQNHFIDNLFDNQIARELVK